MKFNKTLIKFLVLLFIFVCAFVFLPVTSKAANSNGFTKLNNAPRKYFSVSSDKLSDITMTIVCDTKINSVKCYTTDSSGNNKKETTISSITSNGKNYIYTLSHNELLKGNKNYFYIEVKDDYGNIHNSSFTVIPKNKSVNNQTVQYYEVNDSPRIKTFSAENKQISFVLKDLNGVKSLKAYDINNSDKEVYSSTDFNKGNSNVSIDLDTLKVDNDVYKLKFVSKDNDSTYSKQTTQTINFTVSKEAMIVTDTSKKYDFNFSDIKFTKVGTYDTGAQYNYIQAMDYYNGNYYVSTYNYVGSSHYNSIIKLNSNFGLVKNTGNILDGVKITGIVCSANGNELFLSYNQKNKVRVYNPNTLESISSSTIANIGSTTNAMSYDRKNKRYAIKAGNLKYISIVDGVTGKVIKKIPRKAGGDPGQDICIYGDYIIDLMVKTSTVDIYSISQGKYIRSDKINYNDNVTFGSNFEPEGICQISDNEFVIGVASSNSSNHMCVVFYKGALKEAKK